MNHLTEQLIMLPALVVMDSALWGWLVWFTIFLAGFGVGQVIEQRKQR